MIAYCQLYQLRGKSMFPLSVGSYFPIDGAWDKHGQVVQVIEKTGDNEYLYLVRGTKTDVRERI